MNQIPPQHQLRAKLETMALGDLLGSAGGEGEELTERTVRVGFRSIPAILADFMHGYDSFMAELPACGQRDGAEWLA